MKSKVFESTPISGLLIYKPKVYRDTRGYFFESFNSSHFDSEGIPNTFVQDNRSLSTYGTLRGLHLQRGEYSQAKLVGVLSGKILDVVVDTRPNSNTLGHHYSITLDASEDPRFLYIPRGFAHGFLVLSETAEFYYKVDNLYNRESEATILYNDPELDIQWPKLKIPYLLSEKDKQANTFSHFLSHP